MIGIVEKIKRFIQERPHLYDFKTITPEKLGEFPDGLDRIKKRQHDGFLVKNFLSKEEVESILKGFKGLSDSEYIKTKVGGVYPAVFQQLFELTKNDDDETSKEKFKSYFSECELYYNEFSERFGVDFRYKIEHAIEQISGGRTVEVPTGYNSEGRYAFCTFRCLNPEKGEMGFHTGNLFRESYKKFYDHLESKASTYNQLSFFVLLQEPDFGGELSLYDIEWEDGQTKFEDKYVLDTNGKKRNIGSIDRKIMTVKPSVGDMVLFNGAQIWHRVEFVQGKTDRITIGGFLAFSADDKKVIYWS